MRCFNYLKHEAIIAQLLVILNTFGPLSAGLIQNLISAYTRVVGTFIIYFTSMGAGAVLEYLYFVVHNKIVGKPIRVNHHLSIGKALSIYSLPMWGLLGVMAIGHYPAVKMFMYSALVGTFFEFATGFILFHVFGIKIWTYKYGSLGKFTSIYSLPYWGGAGIIFLTLSKFL